MAVVWLLTHLNNKTCTQPNEQGCNAQPNQGIKAPKLTANKGSLAVEINGLPNQRYQVEFLVIKMRHQKKLSNI